MTWSCKIENIFTDVKSICVCHDWTETLVAVTSKSPVNNVVILLWLSSCGSGWDLYTRYSVLSTFSSDNYMDEKSRVGFTVMAFVLLSLLYCKCCVTRCFVMMQIPFVYQIISFLLTCTMKCPQNLNVECLLNCLGGVNATVKCIFAYILCEHSPCHLKLPHETSLEVS